MVGIIRRTVMIPLTQFVSALITGAMELLIGEIQGYAIDATTAGGEVACRDSGTPANNLSNVPLDSSNITQSGTSPKLVPWNDSTLHWTPQNMFLNSGVPATQSVTVVTGFVYTVTVTGAGGGSLTGSSGASGVATTGSPVTFTATGTTATWTLSGSLSTMQMNRGRAATAYLVTTGAARIGIPQAYDLAAGQFGILIEPAATNLCLQSETIDNASWTKSHFSISANATTAPDGASTADKLVEDTATGVHDIEQTIAISSGATYTISAFAKAAERSKIEFMIFNSVFSAYFGAQFDLSAGAVASTLQLGAATYISSSITSVGSGWYRLTATGTITDTSAVLLYCSMSGDSDSYLGDGASGVYVWGLDVELGNVATSYIPTISVAVSRAADVLTVAGATFPLSTTVNTTYADYRLAGITAAEQEIFTIDNGAATDYFAGTSTATTGIVAVNVRSADVSVAALSLGAQPTVRGQISFASQVNNYSASLNGSAVIVDTTGAYPVGLTTLRLGDFFFSFPLNGYLYRFVQVPRRVTDVELPTWRYNYP